MATTTQTTTVKVSPPGTLVWKDAIKAFLIAVFTSPLTIIYTSLQAGTFNINWTAVGIAAATSALAYILKQVSSTTVTLASCILLIMCFSGFNASAQSMFSALPKPAKANPFVHLQLSTTTASPDSTFTGFRFTGPMVLYALPNQTIFTGVGVAYEHDTYNSTTGKWYSVWSVAVGGYEGGQIAPSNVSAVTAVGLSVAFFNKLVTVGVLYNISNKNFQGALGPQVSLNN